MIDLSIFCIQINMLQINMLLNLSFQRNEVRSVNEIPRFFDQECFYELIQLEHLDFLHISKHPANKETKALFFMGVVIAAFRLQDSFISIIFSIDSWIILSFSHRVMSPQYGGPILVFECKQQISFLMYMYSNSTFFITQREETFNRRECWPEINIRRCL